MSLKYRTGWELSPLDPRSIEEPMLPAASFLEASRRDPEAPDAPLYSALLIQDGRELYEAHTAIIAFGARGSSVLRDRCIAAAARLQLEPKEREPKAAGGLPGLRLRIDITDLNLDALAVAGVLEWMHGETPSMLDPQSTTSFRVGQATPVNRQLDLQMVCELEKAATALGVLSLVREIHERLLLLPRENFRKARNPHDAFDAVARIISEGKRSTLNVLHHYLERTAATISDQDKVLLLNAVKASKAEQKGKHAIKNRWRRVRRLSQMMAQRHNAAIVRKTTVAGEHAEDEAGDISAQEDTTVTIGRARCGFDADLMGGTEAGLCSIEEEEEFQVIFLREGNDWCGIQRSNGERGYVPTYAVMMIGEMTTEEEEEEEEEDHP